MKFLTQVKAVTEQRWGQNWESFDGLGRHECDFREKHAPDSTAKACAVTGVTVVPGVYVTGERLWDAEESYVCGKVGPIYVRYL